jgi:hypothetical protein
MSGELTTAEILGMAADIAPAGRLRPYLPPLPEWRQSIGSEVRLTVLHLKRSLTPRQVYQLADTWRSAIARQAEAADPSTTAMLFTFDRRARCWHRCAIALPEALSAPTRGTA